MKSLEEIWAQATILKKYIVNNKNKSLNKSPYILHLTLINGFQQYYKMERFK